MNVNRLLFVILLFFAGLGVNAQFGFERVLDIPVTEASELQTMPWAGGLDYCQFSNIDLDFDGDLDLFVFDRTCDKVLTFIQNGAPGEMDWEYDPSYESIFPEGMHDWALLVDYNCDGLEDIYTYATGGVMVYRNTGDAGSGHSFVLESPFLFTVFWSPPASPMYFNSVDIPCFIDVDGDGDMDCLQFGSAAVAVEYNKNLSMETYGVCDSLIYETKNECWGGFKEDGSSSAIELYATTYPCNGTLPDEESWKPDTDRGDRHAGSTVLALDLDGSGVLDLIVGDVGSPNLLWMYNDGAAPNMDSDMYDYDLNIPTNSDSVHLNNMPAAFHVDIDNDGNRDLVVSPADVVDSHNWESVWWYTNSGVDDVPVFDYQGRDFLQGNMLDNGSNSLPAFFDANGDGLKDLLLSCQTKFDDATESKYSTIQYYQNTGTLADPEFELITDDYEDIAMMGIGTGFHFYPAFGDLDGDGDEDMILGEYDGFLYFMQNTGGAGETAIFNTNIVLMDNASTPIDRGYAPNPHLLDLDRDGDLDLVIGGLNGFLTYYENVGTASSYSFEWVTDSLGGVDVSNYYENAGSNVPAFVDIEGEWELLSGAKNGYLHYYDNIEGNIDGVWNEVDSTLEDINIGMFSAPAIYDITDDQHLEMVLGNERGGLGFYKSALLSDIGICDCTAPSFNIYPNPARTEVTIDLGTGKFEDIQKTKVKLYDISGRLVYDEWAQSQKVTIGLGQLMRGTYLVEVRNSEQVETKKLIIE